MSASSIGRSPSATPFPLLALRTGVLFPGTVITLPIGRERSIALVRALQKGDVIGVATQRDPDATDPDLHDLHPVGTFARVVDLARLPSGDYRVALEATRRFTLRSLVRKDPHHLAEGEPAVEPGGESEEARLIARALAAEVTSSARAAGASPRSTTLATSPAASPIGWRPCSGSAPTRS